MIVFARYEGNDIIGVENRLSGLIEDIFSIRDTPRSDGQTIFLFPSIMPFRSVFFCADMTGKRKKINAPIAMCSEIKSSDEMKLVDPDMVQYLISEYNRACGILIQ